MRHPRLLFPRHFRTIHEQPSAEGQTHTCFYGFLLLSMLHMISAMCIKWPAKRTLTGKKDLNAAYQCVHTNAKIASKCITIVGKPAFICLGMTFRNTPAPTEYTTISEASIELGNDILTDTSWEATVLQLTHRHLIPREDYLPASDPPVNADQMTVNIEAKEAPMDGFIDDIITITIGNP